MKFNTSTHINKLNDYKIMSHNINKYFLMQVSPAVGWMHKQATHNKNAGNLSSQKLSGY